MFMIQSLDYTRACHGFWESMVRADRMECRETQKTVGFWTLDSYNKAANELRLIVRSRRRAQVYTQTSFEVLVDFVAVQIFASWIDMGKSPDRLDGGCMQAARSFLVGHNCFNSWSLRGRDLFV